MGILFSYPSRLDGLGGSQVFTSLLAEALLRRGHRVGIIEMTSTRSVQIARRFGGPIWTVPVLHPPRRAWSWRGFLRSTYHLQRIIWAFTPDILSIQFPWRQSLPVIGAHVLPHSWRLVVTTHAPGEIRADAPDDRWFRPWLRRLFERADAATAVSEALLHDLIARFPFVRDRSCVIHNGVDPSWFTVPAEPQAAAKERYVLYVGRFDPPKGVDVLLHAWRRVHAHAPGVALWLAGEGSEIDSLRALAQRLGVASHMRFLGRVHPQALPALYRGADLVVMPSRDDSEGLPLVLLEAGASGAICVATRVGGVPEVIEDGATGFLAEPESPGALADAVLRGLRLPAAQRTTMGAAATKRIAEHFSLERTVRAYEELFQSLLGPRKTVSRR